MKKCSFICALLLLVAIMAFSCGEGTTGDDGGEGEGEG